MTRRITQGARGMCIALALTWWFGVEWHKVSSNAKGGPKNEFGVEYVNDSIFFHCNKKQDTKTCIHLKREKQWRNWAEFGWMSCSNLTCLQFIEFNLARFVSFRAFNEVYVLIPNFFKKFLLSYTSALIKELFCLHSLVLEFRPIFLLGTYICPFFSPWISTCSARICTTCFCLTHYCNVWLSACEASACRMV